MGHSRLTVQEQHLISLVNFSVVHVLVIEIINLATLLILQLFSLRQAPQSCLLFGLEIAGQDLIVEVVDFRLLRLVLLRQIARGSTR